jgi:hypothetical protein
MLFGYELEFFCINKRGEIVVPKPELSGFVDAGGILLEARGEPMPHPKLAEASLRLKIAELKKIVRKARRRLLLADEGDVNPRSLVYARSHKKDFDDVTPIYERFRNPVRLRHRQPGHYKAGLHVHLSKPDEYNKGKFLPFDLIYPVRLLDQEFHEYIREAHRHPGAYRMQDYGLEYRSLPATIRLGDVTRALCKMLAPREFEAYPDSQIPDDEDEL